MEDAQIVALFFERSEQAVRELDAKYGNICRRFSLRIVGSEQDAEECVNDAWLGAWNAIPPAKPDPLLNYLLKIVRNLSLKCYWKKAAAKRGGQYTVALQEIGDALADRASVEDEVEVRELARRIERFLDTLSAENRVIFLRRYWFSDSYGDIAARTGLSEKTVSVRLTRIRARLKAYLAEGGTSL